MAELSEHEILWNTPALTSLRRQQLMSLSKKYGLKANGKNTEMIQRLHEFGHTLTPGAKTAFNFAAATATDNSSPTKMPASRNQDDVVPALASSPQKQPEETPAETPAAPAERRIGFPSSVPSPPQQRSAIPPSRSTRSMRESETWEVLTTGDSSLIEGCDMDLDTGDESGGSTRSWKTAGNGKAMDDFNPNTKSYGELRNVGSIRSLASTIKRKASRTLSGSRNNRDAKVEPGLALPSSFQPLTAHEPSKDDEEEQDEDVEMLPPSPASAIGVAKRHSTMSLNHRPSTIRLVSSSAELVQQKIEQNDFAPIDDELPLTGINSMDKIKKRRSQIQPAASPRKSVRPSPRKSRAGRPSLSVLSPTASATGIYPPLPNVSHPATPVKELASPEVPGSYPKTSKPISPNPTSPSFVFGAGNGTTGSDFSDAGMKLLQEMQTKMGGAGTFNSELLKGKRAEITKLVAVNDEVGSGASTGGWGLLSSGSSSAANKDRFADAHQRAFSKMQGIEAIASPKRKRSEEQVAVAVTPGKRKLESTSASMSTTVNGLPVPDPEASRGAKRSKMSTLSHKASTGLKYFNSLRGGSVKESTPSRMRSNLRKESRPRLGFLSRKPSSSNSIGSTTSDDFVKITAPGEVTAGKAARIPMVVATEATPGTLRRATVVQTNMQKSLSKRAPIPSFTPSTSSVPPSTRVPLKDPDAEVVAGSSSGSGSTLRKAPSISRSLGSRQLSQFASGDDLKGSLGKSSIKAIAESEPSSGRSTPTRSLSSRPSTLFAPTASSKARMQSTVKPPTPGPSTASGAPAARRPLPRPPKSPVQIAGPQLSTLSPFGVASSRMTHLFESNFHMPPPKAADNAGGAAAKPATKSASAGPSAELLSPRKRLTTSVMSSRPTISSPMKLGSVKSPARAGLSAQRARDKASGAAALKARNHDDAGVAQRRADIKAKQDRLREERELRSMLG